MKQVISRRLISTDSTVQKIDPTALYLNELLFHLKTNCFRCQGSDKQAFIDRAFNFLVKSAGHDTYLIDHSLEVADVIGSEIGLGATSVVSALLHELPEKTDIEISDIRRKFGEEVGQIIDGFYKIKNTEEYFKPDDAQNAELYKQIVLNMAKDLRIISLRIADRLVTLRHFDEISVSNKRIIPEETLKVYAPIADVLGSYRVKMELEDLAFKYYKPEVYNTISSQLKSSFRENTIILNKVALPIIKELFDRNFRFKILSRQKSIYSIYRKMHQKNLQSIDQIYDILAFRIIIFSDSNLSKDEKLNQEKILCKEVGQIIQNLYQVHPDRIRNWIDRPKEGTGYMALHLTVLHPETKRWVEIQIRGEEMHEIAEYGYAAHWKYKGVKMQLDKFAQQLREVKRALESVDEDIDAVFELVQPLIPVDMVSVYTPDLEEHRLTKGATVLDFAAKVHSDLLRNILGAKINRKNTVPPTYQLSNGDIVEIITAQKPIVPKYEWFNYVRTNKAKRILRQLINLRSPSAKGKEILFDLARSRKMNVDSTLIKSLLASFNLNSKEDLYVKIATKEISDHQLLTIFSKVKKSSFFNFVRRFSKHKKPIENYRIASCCNPKPNDSIVAVEIEPNFYEIHKVDCKFIDHYLDQRKVLIPVEWKRFKQQTVLRQLKIETKAEIDLIYQVSKILYSSLSVDIISFSFQKDESKNKYFGVIKFYAASDKDLNRLVEQLENLKPVTKVKVF